MHFIAMLGFSVPGQVISYNVPITIASMVIAIAVVGVGLVIVGSGDGGKPRLLAGGLIVGTGVATMHYLGMAAMVMSGSMSYNTPLVIASVAIAVIAGTAALWIGTWVRGIGATAGASLVMGVAVSGMHYTGMAAMRVHAGGMAGMPGATSDSFLLPLLLGITLITFVLTLIMSLSPTEAEMREDAEFHYWLETLQVQAVPAVSAGEETPVFGDPVEGHEDSVLGPRGWDLQEPDLTRGYVGYPPATLTPAFTAYPYLATNGARSGAPNRARITLKAASFSSPKRRTLTVYGSAVTNTGGPVLL